jgi:hypothetical protein
MKAHWITHNNIWNSCCFKHLNFRWNIIKFLWYRHFNYLNFQFSVFIKLSKNQPSYSLHKIMLQNPKIHTIVNIIETFGINCCEWFFVKDYTYKENKRNEPKSGSLLYEGTINGSRILLLIL